MKVALIIQNPDPRLGGAELYTLNLARSLAARGHEVTLAAEDGPASTRDEVQRAGITCRYFGRHGRSRWARMQGFLDKARELFDARRHDIIHAMLPVWKCDVYQPHAGLATYLQARGHLKHPNAIVQRLSQMANHLNPKRVDQARVEQALMTGSGGGRPPLLLSISFLMHDYARDYFHYPDDRMEMLRYGIDLDRFDPASDAYPARESMRSQWKLRPEQRVGIFIGHNWIRKGVPEAIAAMGRLKAQGTGENLVLLLAGRDDPRPYRKQAQRLGVAERIRFADTAADPPAFYRAADFLLLPTRQDTCSIVVLEALVMGLPVITTLQNGASELIVPGRQGLLMERGDSSALAQAMAAMLDDRSRTAMAAEALAMRECFGQRAHVDAIERIYQKVIATRPLQNAVAHP
jgi:UDP-glucose:(heptosyl)LPS alpha-1,3-glucosyltransferase